MRHKLIDLDEIQLEKLLSSYTLDEIADCYNVSRNTISNLMTGIFSRKKKNKLVEKEGSWMKSEEREAFKSRTKKDSWLELKETNLYKQLINKHGKIKQRTV